MTTIYSCVIDRQPMYRYQGLVFASTLIDLGGVDPSNIVVHAMEGVPHKTRDDLRRLGVSVVTMSPFDPRHPYSNKLVQLQSRALRDADHVVLCDADLAFAGPIAQWIAGPRLRGKTVDYALPPIPVWRDILAAFRFDSEPASRPATHSGEPTYANNLNGGLYIVPQPIFERLGAIWPEWNRRVLDRVDLLGEYHVHVDQVSLALALTEMGEEIDYLPPGLNFPTHVPFRSGPLKEPPLVLHYHTRMNPRGRLLPMGEPVVDKSTALVNKAIARRGLAAAPLRKTLVMAAKHWVKNWRRPARAAS
jgi:hypothetical protein